MKTEKLNLKDFVKRISKSKSLYLVERGIMQKVKIEKSYYGGFRTDRLSERNRITNVLGFKHCEDREFMDCSDGEGGTFLANVLEDYGKDCYFLENGVPLSYETDIQITKGDYMVFNNKKHFNQVRKPKAIDYWVINHIKKPKL